MSWRGLIAAGALWLGGLTGTARAECRLALALALDVSGSVNFMEYRLQLDGVANALTHPEVVSAIITTPGAEVALAIYEWSGPDFQRVLVDWTRLAGPADVAEVAAQLRGTNRVTADPSTAIGAAMRFGAVVLQGAPPCWRQVIDISGDGKSNTGPNPRDVTMPEEVMVNALVIGGELIDPAENRAVGLPELTAYFRAYVIRGPEAFVEVARGFYDFESAMVRKLKRELMVVAVSDAGSAAAAQ
ncbi:DUF1194 domain-containing protein [Pseudooceanicola sp.]|uniref:DUF1194 domain-containing protein n=1 Tax=Pseudooceanicola sp. TaxID=1914328 RepID=UPI00405920B1